MLPMETEEREDDDLRDSSGSDEALDKLAIRLIREGQLKYEKDAHHWSIRLYENTWYHYANFRVATRAWINYTFKD